MIINKIKRDGFIEFLVVLKNIIYDFYRRYKIKLLSKILFKFKIKKLKKVLLSKTIFIFTETVEWTFMFQRPQQLATEFSKKENVIVLYLTLQKFDDFYIYKKINDGLFLFSSLFLDKLNLLLDDCRNKILLIEKPRIYRTIRNIKYDFLIYDIIDDISFFADYSEKLICVHNEILTKADLTIATATNLYNQAQPFSKKLILANNACDYNFFHNAKTTLINKEIKERLKSYKCVLGYYGALSHWFDYELIKNVAIKRPDWVWLLVGSELGNSTRDSGIKTLPNVICTGAKSYKNLPYYINDFDIQTIPFIINDITLSTSPVKLFEYMATGKPILTCDIPECRKYKSVYIYDNADDFIAKTELLITLKDDADYLKLLDDEAKENTWEKRAELILNNISLFNTKEE
jgi:glycosyltransferase involved in cell wall biosynthesis